MTRQRSKQQQTCRTVLTVGLFIFSNTKENVLTSMGQAKGPKT